METVSGSVCRACRLRMSKPLQRGTFSTSSRLASIPPESPHYIDVPLSHQAEHHQPRRAKGILPVPRELFPARRPDKPSEQYILNAIPARQKPIDASKLDALGRYKMQMGLMRKQHFREGLIELYQRKQDTERSMIRRSNAKKAERTRLLSQAEREDARLTNVSTPHAMQPKKLKPLSSTDAEEIYETKKANVERRHAAKQAGRQDALHTLYMNARHFITNEQQLAAALTQAFDPSQFGGPMSDPNKNHWDGVGVPDTVREMINRTFLSPRFLGTQSSTQDEEAYRKDQSRMKRIAEKLSGGKI